MTPLLVDAGAMAGPFAEAVTNAIPFPALFGAMVIAIMASVVLTVSWYFDQRTRGFLTISIVVVLSFVAATFASMIYTVPTSPVTEILVGALSTALGAVVSQWVGRERKPPEDGDDKGLQ